LLACYRLNLDAGRGRRVLDRRRPATLRAPSGHLYFHLHRPPSQRDGAACSPLRL